MTQLKLRIQIEGNSDSIVSVAKDEFIIGRLPTCDLCLPFSEISRHHAHFLQSPNGEWLLEDLGSMNGTQLNQVPLAAARKVNHGDTIQVGNIVIFVLLELSSSSQEASNEVRTILRSAEQLQQQWIKPDEPGNTYLNQETTIARLQYLVEIAKGLNSAESIEAVFAQIQEILFREMKTLLRLALLVDIDGNGQLHLLQTASRDTGADHTQIRKGTWISNTIAKKAFLEKVAIKTADAQQDERFEGENSILAKGIQGALAVPLWDKDKVVGVLYADAQLYYLPALDPLEDQDLSFFSTIANLVASSVQRWLLTRKIQSHERIRQQLERYHSPAVVQQLIAVGAIENGRIQPVEADISILFADLVGFSSFSERLTPSEISTLLNRFFEEMLKPVFASGGTLDKFIGDCIMAFFGAPEPQPYHADRAVTAAKEMLKHLNRLNAAKTWPFPLELRIAINSGKAVVGDVGSAQRVDYTVLGTTVNIASRMEGLCEPSECVISEDTFDRLKNPNGFNPMGNFRLKGIDRPVKLYRLRIDS